MRDTLKRKIEQSIKLLQSYDLFCKDRFPLELAYSGGKDSDVILNLAKEAAIDFQPIHKMTTIDPPGTIKHVREMGVEIRKPNLSFFQLIERKGLPSRRMRFCCDKLKEYKILDKVIVGVRASESRKRKELYKEPSNCRGSQSKAVEQILPILYWTDEDVKEYIEDRNIKCAPIYYDTNGNFCVKRRLGCMCCPLLGYKHRLEEFRQYPNIAKAYIKSCQIYLDNHKRGKAYIYNQGNPYRFFLRDLFPYTNSKWENICSGLFGSPDFEAIFNQLIINQNLSKKNRL